MGWRKETKHPLKTLDCAVVKHQNPQELRSLSFFSGTTSNKLLSEHCLIRCDLQKCAWQIPGCFSSVYLNFLCSVCGECLWMIHVYCILHRLSVKSSFWEVRDWSQQHMSVFEHLKHPFVLVTVGLQGCFRNSLCQTVDLYISDRDWLHWFAAIHWFDVV